MKTWALMYGIIWLAFVEIMTAIFLPFGFLVNTAIHSIIGVTLILFAYFIYREVALTPCPDRIKRITRTTFALSLFEAVLGILLVAGIVWSLGGTFLTLMSFLHIGNALAIITQASSSATGFDMWEEKEFEIPVTVVRRS